MVQTVRVAIIGAGQISNRHMQIYKNMNQLAEELGFRAEVVAVAEIRPDRLKAWAEKYGIAEKDCYADYHEMLKRDDIDTVDVCVHNNLHTPVSIEVMKAGFDCYCEKPASASYADTKLTIDAAAKLGRKFHTQISSCMTPQSRKAREYVRSGKLGNVYLINQETAMFRRRPGYDLPFFTPDFCSAKIAGHGQSIDCGIYILGQLLFIMDCPKPVSINGFTGTFMPVEDSLCRSEGGFGVEDTLDGFVKFENGMGLHFTSMSANNVKDYTFTHIHGTEGGLEVLNTDMAGGRLARPDPNGRPMFGGEPELKYICAQNGEITETMLNCDSNGNLEMRRDPKMRYYYDNQCMWLAYHLGILNDETRYNTPEIALQMNLLVDGIFLSSERGRSVTAEEVIADSPSLYIRSQEIAGKNYTFDLDV